MRRLVSIAIFALGVGCSAAAGTTPRSTLRAYGEAIADGRADEAYALLSDDAKKIISRDAFRDMVKKNPQEAMELGKALARDPGDPYVTAKVELPNGDVVTLVFEDGRWRVDGQALEFYSQATPRGAIVGFVKAFRRERWDVLLKYTPDAHREGLTAERLAAAWGKGKPEGDHVGQLVGEIERALPTAKFEETGDRATMVYGSGGTVLFVREKGAWKIEDLK